MIVEESAGSKSFAAEIYTATAIPDCVQLAKQDTDLCLHMTFVLKTSSS